MKRTNIYLDEAQLDRLTRYARSRGLATAEAVREAVEEYLVARDVKAVAGDEWQRRLDALGERRGHAAKDAGWTQDEVDRDVSAAVDEVRGGKRARRR